MKKVIIRATTTCHLNRSCETTLSLEYLNTRDAGCQVATEVTYSCPTSKRKQVKRRKSILSLRKYFFINQYL